MEDLLKIAEIYYNSGSSDLKDLAHNFFKSLDFDGDNKVSLHEFLSFMRQHGHTKMSSRHFFEELDKDSNGSLEFMEVMGLYYIIKSGRPFCEGCDSFIPTTFFTCSKCFDRADKPFCVCTACFGNGKFIHEHGLDCFLDNYALLEAKRKEAMGKRMAAHASPDNKPSSTVTFTEIQQSASPSNNTSTAMVLFNPEQNPLIHLHRFVQGAINATVHAISNCNIM
ncbi:unnamed protein product [Camellia sinensis]